MPRMPDALAFLNPAEIEQTALWILVTVSGALVALSLVFAAYTLTLRAGHRLRERRWERLRVLWTEPFLRALSDPGATGAVHALVEPRYELHFLQFALDFARRLTGRERTTVAALAGPYLPRLVPRTRSRQAEIRTRAVQTLGTLGLPDYEDTVMAALDDRAPLVAMVAATTLARRRDPRYTEAILSHLDRFDSWSDNFLASMLTGMGPEGAGALRATLGDPDGNPRVRSVAARALAGLPDVEAGPLARSVVRDAADPDLIIAALRLLARVGGPDDADVVRARCASPNAAVRAKALHALGALGGPPDVPRLMDALSDPSPWVAIGAARGLWEAGAEERLQELRASDHPRALLADQILAENDR